MGGSSDGRVGISDPFNDVRSKILKEWALLQRDESSRTAFETAESHFLNRAQRIEWDLRDLEETVKVVELNRDKFRLDEAELANRRAFISDMRARMSKIRTRASTDTNGVLIDLETDTTSEKEEKETMHHPKARGRGTQHGRLARDTSKAERANDEFIEGELQVQERLVQEQDEGLTVLGDAVERIGEMGREIHRELNEHNELMDGLGDDMDSAKSRMASVQGKLRQFMSETSKKELCTILWLFISFLVLTFLVFAT